MKLDLTLVKKIALTLVHKILLDEYVQCTCTVYMYNCLQRLVTVVQMLMRMMIND